MKKTRLLYAALPLALFAPDALAWGLQTHLFFAQYALLFVPLADPELRTAAARLPRLVLAGACLPDLSLIGRALGTPVFCRSHLWATLRRIAAVPLHDGDRALALGYASHLLSDVVAHNEFVPEHERRIARVGILTHAFAEWAMDEHVREQVFAAPSDLLGRDNRPVVEFIARGFRCSEALARRAVELLGRADGVLRASRAPALCRRALRAFDRHCTLRFETHLRKAALRLQRLEDALAGRLADWSGSDPEGNGADQGADARARQHIARIMQTQDHA